MIVSIGIADRSSNGYKLAQYLSSLNAPVSFLAPFSNSSEHLNLLEEIIDQCILFDPVFCNTDGLIEDITSQRLITAFSVNSDIEYVCIEEELFAHKSVEKAVNEAMKTVDAKLVTYKESDSVECIAEKLK